MFARKTSSFSARVSLHAAKPDETFHSNHTHTTCSHMYLQKVVHRLIGVKGSKEFSVWADSRATKNCTVAALGLGAEILSSNNS